MNEIQIAADRADYLAFVEELGVSQGVIDAIVHTNDLVPMPPGFEVEVSPSFIHGHGLFALEAYLKDGWICPGRIQGHRTPAGRFINHSSRPNAIWVRRDADLWAIALKDIATGDEILMDYRSAVAVNFGITLAPLQERILSELVKLNKSMEKLVCFQKLASERYAATHPNSRLGQPAGTVVEGQGELPHAPLAQDPADRRAGQSHV